MNFDGGKALEAFDKGIELDQEFLNTYCSNSVEGIEKMVEWIKKLD